LPRRAYYWYVVDYLFLMIFSFIHIFHSGDLFGADINMTLPDDAKQHERETMEKSAFQDAMQA
jgi:hypothetical protein